MKGPSACAGGPFGLSFHPSPFTPMTFTVKYRANDGKVREESIEAANRSECVAKCKARGWILVSAEEGKTKASLGIKGWVKKKVIRQNTKCNNKVQRFIIFSMLALIVIAIVCIATFMFSSKRDAIKSVHVKSKKHKVSIHSHKGASNSKEIITTNSTTVRAMLPQKRIDHSGSDASHMMSLEGEAKTAEQILYRKRLAAISNQVFNTASDQILAMAISNSKTATPPIPVQQLSDEAFRKSLETPIEILPSDTPYIKELKETVLETRAELLKMLAKGYHVSEVLAEHQKLAQENYDIRKRAEQELREIYASGDKEHAQRYASSINAALQQMGIDPIKVDGRPSNRARENFQRYQAEREKERHN